MASLAPSRRFFWTGTLTLSQLVMKARMRARVRARAR